MMMHSCSGCPKLSAVKDGSLETDYDAEQCQALVSKQSFPNVTSYYLNDNLLLDEL
jgi:hypothetical protein